MIYLTKFSIFHKRSRMPHFMVLKAACGRRFPTPLIYNLETLPARVIRPEGGGVPKRHARNRLSLIIKLSNDKLGICFAYRVFIDEILSNVSQNGVLPVLHCYVFLFMLIYSISVLNAK